MSFERTGLGGIVCAMEGGIPLLSCLTGLTGAPCVIRQHPTDALLLLQHIVGVLGTWNTFLTGGMCQGHDVSVRGVHHGAPVMVLFNRSFGARIRGTGSP